MAAAALSRSRGVAGVRTTEGLFFMFTLLCLACLTSSLTDKDQLEKLKENVLKTQLQMDRLKAARGTTAEGGEILSEYMSLMDPMIALVKKSSEAIPDFPPLEGLLEKIKGFMEKTKTYTDEQNVKFDAKMEEIEQKLGKIKKFIKFLEEQQAEL